MPKRNTSVSRGDSSQSTVTSSTKKIMIGRRTKASSFASSTGKGPPESSSKRPPLASLSDNVSASPIKGAQRFIALSSDKEAGKKLVNKRTKEILEKMKNIGNNVTSSPAMDPAMETLKSPAAVPGISILNRLNTEFSPSPVKKRIVQQQEINDSPVSRLSAGSTRRRGTERVTSTMARNIVPNRENIRSKAAEMEKQSGTNDSEKHAAETSPDQALPRPSDAFQPTPAIFKQSTQPIGGPKNVSPEDDLPKVVESDSDADLGFDQPSSKRDANSNPPFSVATDPGFKRPSLPPKKKARVGSQASLVSGSSTASGFVRNSESDAPESSTKKKYLQGWRPLLKKEKLYVEGHLLDLDSTDLGLSDQIWLTSKITTRITSRQVATKGGTNYVLEGPLVPKTNPELSVRGKNDVKEDYPMPLFIQDRFSQGFPENWERLVSQWVRFAERSLEASKLASINNLTATLGNSTQGIALSQIGGNISGISLLGHSRFLVPNNGTRIMSLTMSDRTCVDIIGGSEASGFQVVGSTKRARSPEPEVVPRDAKRVSVGGRSGPSLSSGLTQQLTYSPIREEVEGDDQEVTFKAAEHESRSKEVRTNVNASSAPLTKAGASTVKQTMSAKEIYLLKAKDYKELIMDGKKKKYRCRFCDYVAPVFHALKDHYTKHHLEEVSDREERSKSEEVPATPPPQELTAKRRSISAPPKKNERRRSLRLEDSAKQCPRESQSPDPADEIKVGEKNYICTLCNFKQTSKAKAATHINSKRHKAAKESAAKQVDNEKGGASDQDDCSNEAVTEAVREQPKGRSQSRNKKDSREVENNNVESRQENTHDLANQADEKQSRFGRNIKKNPAHARESCVYNTPEENDNPKPVSKAKSRKKGSDQTNKITNYIDKQSPQETTTNSKSILKKPKSGKSQNPKSKVPPRTAEVSLRRTVIDKFKRKSTHNSPAQEHEEFVEVPKVASRISLNPKTIKERQNNLEAVEDYNKDHEDDLFDDVASKGNKKPLLKTKTKNLLEDSDSESENEISVHTARTPTSAYMRKSVDSDKTPKVIPTKSPAVAYDRQGYQNQAYLHKKITENAGDARKIRKLKLKSAVVSKVSSRARMDAMIDESSKVIRNMTQEGNGSKADEDDGAEAWFDEDNWG